ncbi:HAD family hydrolase [Baaleninema simplex]|uniref:HAD family hydrolase n=1 Tax=Baaleninema simplex TaxID=2862350 RepID=UPI00034DCB9C|nr:HAD family phosphatase [Baaleninema simplex]
MGLKAVIFDFNGVVINDEPIHERLISQLLLEENLRPNPKDFQAVCLGRSDRVALKMLFERRGRCVTEEYLGELMRRKSQMYLEELSQMETLPSYEGLTDFILKLRLENLQLALVSGALRVEIETVLDRLGLTEQFPIIVAGDDIATSKPEPDGYLLAVEKLGLKPSECLAIEDAPAGIEAAQRAGLQAVGVANTYPVHMLQRQADWVVDYLSELELDRVREAFETEVPARLGASPEASSSD